MDKQLKEQVEEIAREEAANRYSYNTAYHTRRIADILGEILSLVKEDLKESKKRWAEKDEQSCWARQGAHLNQSLALAPGAGPELQATSGKLQASSRKLDKKVL